MMNTRVQKVISWCQVKEKRQQISNRWREILTTVSSFMLLKKIHKAGREEKMPQDGGQSPLRGALGGGSFRSCRTRHGCKYWACHVEPPSKDSPSLPKWPRTFHCYQPFCYSSASFYSPKPEPWWSLSLSAHCLHQQVSPLLCRRRNIPGSRSWMSSSGLRP